MSNHTSQNSSSEKGRQGWDNPAAKLRDPTGNVGRANQASAAARNQLVELHQNVPRVPRGKRLAANRRKSSSQNANNISSLPPLRRSEFIREVQELATEVPLGQAMDEQNAVARTIENQRAGESGIQSLALLNWGRANPRVRARIARLIGLSGAVTDPDFMEGAEKLADYFARQALGIPEHEDPSSCHSAGDEDQDLATGDLFEGSWR